MEQWQGKSEHVEWRELLPNCQNEGSKVFTPGLLPKSKLKK